MAKGFALERLWRSGEALRFPKGKFSDSF